ncbi:MAG: hypothetical protein M1142_05615 [Patescibacteria group bacterium]|nr:hypothetical protein [Patescibacteria group bacterium]
MIAEYELRKLSNSRSIFAEGLKRTEDRYGFEAPVTKLATRLWDKCGLLQLPQGYIEKKSEICEVIAKSFVVTHFSIPAVTLDIALNLSRYILCTTEIAWERIQQK